MINLGVVLGLVGGSCAGYLTGVLIIHLTDRPRARPRHHRTRNR